jgi:D-amino peptidase
MAARSREKAKRVYFVTDLEGVCGVDDWDPRHASYGDTAKGVYERSEMQRLLTGEINAAAEGCLAGGADEILVNDSHGAGRTILVEELRAGVRLYRGTERPYWLPGLDATYDALLQVGMHAKSNTPYGTLTHTCTGDVREYRLNGVSVGEMGIAAAMAGYFGVPWVFVSGDLHACREAERLAKGILCAPVKEGLSRHSAIHLAPSDARELIRERAEQGVRRAKEIRPVVFKPPYALEVEWRKEVFTKAKVSGPGVEFINERTLRYRGRDLLLVLNHAIHGQRRPPDRRVLSAGWFRP